MRPAQTIDAVPDTFQRLERHASQVPDTVAIRDNGRETTYGALHDRVARVAGALEDLLPSAAPQGAAIDFGAVEWGDMTSHATLLLALEAIGRATVSYRDEAPTRELRPVLNRTSFILCSSESDKISPAETPTAKFVLDAAWWRAAEEHAPHFEPRGMALDAPHRLACSSGTTGTPKIMAQTFAQTEARIRGCQERFRYSPESRLALDIPFHFQAGYIHALACWRAGGVCLFDDRQPIWRTVAQWNASHAVLLPFHVAELPGQSDGAPAIDSSPILAFYGGRVPAPARDAIHGIAPHSEVLEVYATNEAGSISIVEADGESILVTGATVETVGADGAALPMGAEGALRVRTEGMVSGYLFDADATSERFRDGWFYPGDVGQISASGRLLLSGRDDDILNIRGIKYLAPLYEDMLRAHPAIDDICLIERRDVQGLGALWVGLVLADGFGLEKVEPVLRQVFPAGIGTVHTFQTDRIPRTESGKIQRRRIADALPDTAA